MSNIESMEDIHDLFKETIALSVLEEQISDVGQQHFTRPTLELPVDHVRCNRVGLHFPHHPAIGICPAALALYSFDESIGVDLFRNYHEAKEYLRYHWAKECRINIVDNGYKTAGEFWGDQAKINNYFDQKTDTTTYRIEQATGWY